MKQEVQATNSAKKLDRVKEDAAPNILKETPESTEPVARFKDKDEYQILNQKTLLS
ncbi:hypothetical protein HW423_02840 [Aerococcaceae bacterium INB8]|uniref:Uncharacterized protein n=1 Tax=Ruoffia halotolerans TaxID=2748684 RepID=A0A839A3Y8_9LACT|nr:hypothetical protein [Ruoffia halotolerans]MBA5728717.1 hypothetical protein [Ruoffia halotolerans]